MIGFDQNEKFVYIMLELIKGGDFHNYLTKVKQIEVDQAKFYGAQIVNLFTYMHAKRIIYRDLKPENLLIDSTGYLNLIDFGTAKAVDGRTYTLCGTPEYLAPEIITNKGHGWSVDWWSLGIILYEMLAGVTPFYDSDPMCVYQNILRGVVRFKSGFDRQARSLIKHLLQADLTKRFGNLRGGSDDIKNHNFFKKLKWKLLLEQKLKADYIPEQQSGADLMKSPDYGEQTKDVLSVKERDNPFSMW